MFTKGHLIVRRGATTTSNMGVGVSTIYRRTFLLVHGTTGCFFATSTHGSFTSFGTTFNTSGFGLRTITHNKNFTRGLMERGVIHLRHVTICVMCFGDRFVVALTPGNASGKILGRFDLVVFSARAPRHTTVSGTFSFSDTAILLRAGFTSLPIYSSMGYTRCSVWFSTTLHITSGSIGGTLGWSPPNGDETPTYF